MGLIERIRTSFRASIGDIVFGMEDGTVSIFGLVFGMALSAPDSKAVLLAGATGAAAAAVSMMAGSYLDAESERDAARVRAAEPAAQKELEAATLAARVAGALHAAGVPAAKVNMLKAALVSTPGAVQALRRELGPQADGTTASPTAHALWMFVADLFAGAVPVIPFALLPTEEARFASLIVTTVLLVALGVGRGLVAGRNLVRTTFETLLVAASAAAAGVLMGRWIA
ncbi:MAG: VIT1/CCC1 transporter family protein [Hyphomicrobiales bacterium]